MIPAFEVEGGPVLALARFLFVALLLASFGTGLFTALVAPRALARADAPTAARAARRLLRLMRCETAAALPALLAWTVAQAADMAGKADLAGTLAALPVVLGQTEFGHVALAQAGLLAAALTALGLRGGSGAGRMRLATGLVAAALILQAGHGHGWSMYGRPGPLLGAGVLHLLAAGGWLGGLVPLLLLVWDMPPRVGAAAARWFSPLGAWCVGGIVASSAWQFWELVGGLPGLVGTGYGWVTGIKLLLLLGLLGFALFNRYRLAPALLGVAPERARRALVRAVTVQTGVGLLTVLAAGVLSNLQPAMHLQPLWPFPLRPSLDTVNEDTAFRNEVAGAVLALAGALLAVLVTVLLRRRIRWAACLPVAAAVVVAWFAVPHLGLLLVPAYPTSYYRSPTGFAAQAVADGAALFPQHCAACHGPQGKGDGPAAGALPVPPADLTAGHLWMHEDGELFWWLTHGIEAPDGRPAMPGFAEMLSPDQRWALIDYVRAHNAGLVAAATGTWSPPVQAPALQAECPGGRSVTLADLRGGFVRLVFGPQAAPAMPGVFTVLAGADLPAPAPSGPCVARGTAVAMAYAVVSGTAPDALAGMEFLIDGDGWLRAMQRPGQVPGWSDPAALLADVKRFGAQPVAAASGVDHAGMRM